MKIAIIDLETTGFLNEGGLIVEVGIVELDLNTGEKKIIYDELVREPFYNEKHKDSWIFSNSNLKHEDIMNANPLNLREIQDILTIYPVTAYNKEFDLDFLRSRGLEIYSELSCPMRVATQICKIPHPTGYGYKWPKVQEAWEFLFGKTGYLEAHRGADDALHEAEIVYKLYKMGEFRV